MPSRISRRRFLKATAVGSAGYFFTASAISAARAGDGPNGKVHFAGIGIGGKGSGDISQCAKLGTVVAICDIDENNLDKKTNEKDRDGEQHFLSSRRYFDYRKMLDEMGKQIDAVTVSTPDHTHAPASVMAMKMKKHVYTQKPLTHTVHEARVMRETAAKMGVATQMGNQGSAANGLRRAVEAVQAGIIGPVSEAHVWTNRPGGYWKQAPNIMTRPPESPTPSYVHWDEFIGSAPMRPYADYEEKRKDRRTGEERVTRKGYYHDFAWRGWWDFGTGALGDMACHTANMAFRALKLGYPASVVAAATDVNPETYPSSAQVTFQFPARGDMIPVKFMWYEGQKNGKHVLPDPILVKGQRKRSTDEFAVYFADNQWHFFDPTEKEEKNRHQIVSSGSFLVGEKGVLFSPNDYGSKVFVVTENNVKRVEGDPKTLPINNKDDLGMKIEWVEAMKGGPPAYSNFDFAGQLTETILLGNVAIRMNGEKLEWDGPAMKFTNKPDANQFLHYEYRKGWTL
jgi:predicted dehydrogenase